MLPREIKIEKIERSDYFSVHSFTRFRKKYLTRIAYIQPFNRIVIETWAIKPLQIKIIKLKTSDFNTNTVYYFVSQVIKIAAKI